MDDNAFDFEDFEDYDDFDDDEESYDFDDADDADFEDFDGDDLDMFGEYAAEGRNSRRRRRSRRRRIRNARRRRKLAQRRRATRRPRGWGRPSTPKRKIASNRAKIQKVGLESAVKSDVLATGMKAQSKRIGGTESAITAGKVIDEVTAQFPKLNDNKFVKTGLPLAPLLFLKPPKKGDGVESFAFDPRIWGPLLAAGAALINEFQDKNKEPQEIAVTPPNVILRQGGTIQLSAAVRDKNGGIVPERTIVWASLDTSVATVDEHGNVTATSTADESEQVTITAQDTAANLVGAVTITIV